MKPYYPSFILFLILLLASISAAFAQTELLALSGTVHERSTNKSLPGVCASIQGTSTSTQVDGEGKFTLNARLNYPFVPVFTAIRHEPITLPKDASSNPVAVDSDEAALTALLPNRLARQDCYRVYTNAPQDYHSYGSTLGLTYNFYQKYTLAGNVNALLANSQTDVSIIGFNTPKWATNPSFGDREIARNFGFAVNWRWQDSFYWESPLANGQVPAYQTIDAQANLRVPSLKPTIKVGGTDLLNHRYFQYVAGLTLGALYYASVTFDATVLL